ncbi:hypothetical protein MM221_07945 [Salipaludibacillus sp. LMS25]|jgi:hypothetical protein|uniref:hypothetical protein n=1 Tax=Salipaludibacillus sp. LMS25 TaxID=2924031 RepID=UPI0020D01822|nr:hypothetical protein [Salipaludibacillus sp. LMS25]UTR16462.1 hypothetical protein MM221_07945 [Salipaludibacillus sp. LMS25]
MVYKKKHHISMLIIAIVVCVIISFNEDRKKVYQVTNDSELESNSLLGAEFYLDMRYPSKLTDEIIYYPTEKTEEMLARWELIADLFPEIVYPERAVNEENWIEVSDTLEGNKLKMEDVVRVRFQNTSPYDEEDYVSPYSLEVYIYEGRIHTHVGDELGIEDPKFYHK